MSNPMTLQSTPELASLTLTVGYARQLIEADAGPDAWSALTRAAVDEHSPEQLAEMLVGACALIVRMSGVKS